MNYEFILEKKLCIGRNICNNDYNYITNTIMITWKNKYIIKNKQKNFFAIIS